MQTDESDQISNYFSCDAKLKVDYDIFEMLYIFTQHSKLIDMTSHLYQLLERTIMARQYYLVVLY